MERDGTCPPSQWSLIGGGPSFDAINLGDIDRSVASSADLRSGRGHLKQGQLGGLVIGLSFQDASVPLPQLDHGSRRAGHS